MKLCIYGCREAAVALKAVLHDQRKDIAVLYYCVSSADKLPQGDYPDLPVICLSEAHAKIQNNELQGICLPKDITIKTRIEMINELLQLKLKDYIYVEDSDTPPGLVPFSEAYGVKPANDGQSGSISLALLIDRYAQTSVRYLKNIIDNFIDNASVRYFFTNDVGAMAGRQIDGIETVSVYKLPSLYVQGQVDAVALDVFNAKYLQHARLLDMLDDHGIPYYVAPYKLFFTPWLTRRDIESILVPANESYYITKLDVMLTKHCNLNCRGCSHFCGLAKQEEFYDLEQYKKDIGRISQLFGDEINHLFFAGGEPLLHPQLAEFIDLTRARFRYTALHILTNGLLIKKMSRELIESIRKNRVTIFISRYAPTWNRIDEIIKFMIDNKLSYTIGEEVNSFFLRLNCHGLNDKEKMFRKCGSRACTTVYEGQLSSCYCPLTTKYFNDYFHKNVECGEGDIINLHDSNTTASDIMRCFRTPNELCRYCTVNKRSIDWSIMGSSADDEDINDWSVGDD